MVGAGVSPALNLNSTVEMTQPQEWEHWGAAPTTQLLVAALRRAGPVPCLGNTVDLTLMAKARVAPQGMDAQPLPGCST